MGHNTDALKRYIGQRFTYEMLSSQSSARTQSRYPDYTPWAHTCN